MSEAAIKNKLDEPDRLCQFAADLAAKGIGHKVVDASIVAEQMAESRSRALAPEARLAAIAVIFDHTQMLYLEKAELAFEYFEITQQLNSGQDVQNPGRGRPGIISMIARELDLPGKSDAAKRKWLERALNVAGITLEAKAAAKKANVARYQCALLEIATAEGKDEQLRKVEEIVARKRDGKKGAGGQKLLHAMIRFPADRKDEVLAKLATFAEDAEVELLPLS